MPPDLSKYKTQPTARIDLSKYRKAPAAFKYPVQPSSADRQSKIAQYQSEAATAEAESQKANSVGGFLKNFGKAVVSNLASSEVGLGKTLAGIIRPVDKGLMEANQRNEDTKLRVIEQRRKAQAEGRDTSRLDQAFNSLQDNGVATRKDMIVEQPSTQKVVGQLGGTALDLLTAGTYGKVAAGSAKSIAGGAQALPAAGLFTAKGAGRVAAGAATGYAYDVSQGLQDGEGAKAAIPGLGTLIGAGVPLLAGTAKSVQGVATQSGREAKTIEKRSGALFDLEKKYAKVDKAFKAADRKGIDVRKELSETNLLNGAVDTDGMISTEKALSNFNEMIAPFEGQVRQSIEQEGRLLDIKTLEARAKEFVKASRLTGAAKTKLQSELAADLQGFAINGERVPLTALHDTKVYRASHSNWMDTAANEVNKEASRFHRELVEKSTSALDVNTYNAELSKQYAIRDALEALDKTRVKGGRLGKYFSSVIGGAAGGTLAGPLGVIAGAEAGAAAKGIQMSRALGGNLSKALTPPESMVRSLKPTSVGRSALPDVVLPKAGSGIPSVVVQSSKSGSRKIPQTTKATKASVNIPVSIIPSTKRTKASVNSGAFPAEVKSNIVKIIDDYRLNGGKSLELQQDAARIAEDYGVKMPKQYGALVEKLQKLLDTQN